MIECQKIELREENKVRFTWSWRVQHGEMNIYLEKFRENGLEYIGKIICLKSKNYNKDYPYCRNYLDYEIFLRGIYRIVAIPVVNGIEKKACSIKTNYINIGKKNILEYHFEDEKDLNCKSILIKKLDKVLLKDIVYIYSVKDDIKIPFTQDLKQGQKYYIHDVEDIKIEIAYPYNLGVEVRVV